MDINIFRFDEAPDYTIGLLYCNDEFLCYTLEDEYRNEKVYGETRISEGTYEIELRKIGGFHERYKKRFPKIHKGMLHVKNVPEFTHVLFHIGNSDEDTAGCILVGKGADSETGVISKSKIAYIEFYLRCLEALSNGEKLTLNIQSFRFFDFFDTCSN